MAFPIPRPGLLQANTIASLHGWIEFVALQIEYSLIEHTPERDLLPMVKDFDNCHHCLGAAGRGRFDRKVLDSKSSEKRLAA